MTSFAYVPANTGDSIMTTPLVQSITQNGQNFSYTYDNVGNISSVTRNGLTTTYTYDLLGQLIRVNDPHANKTTVYDYDCGGNMLLMLLLSSSSRIFALRSFSSGLRFLLVICFPSCLMSLFYTLLWRFTQNLGRSQNTRI